MFLTHHRFHGRSLACCLVAISLAFPTIATAAPTDDYNLALGLYRKGRWDQAAEQFQSFLKANPSAAEAPAAELYLGLSLVNSEEYEAGRKVLRQYVARNVQGENLADALYRIGESSYFLNDLKQAETDLERFLTRFPKHELCAYALPYLGDVELRLGKPIEAATHFKQSLVEYPKGRLADEATFGLARAAEAVSKPQEAAVLYKQLAEGQSSRADDARLWLGSLEYAEEDYDAAAKEFQKLIVQFPESPLVPAAHLNAGFALYRNGNPQAAITELTIAAETEEQQATALHWIGMSEKALGNSEKAAKAFEAVATDHTDSPVASEALFEWADLTFRDGNFAQAADLYERLVKLQPYSERAAEALYYGAEAAAAGAKVDVAEERLARLQKQFPQTAWNVRGRLLLGQLNERRSRQDGLSAQQVAALQRQAADVYTSVMNSADSADLKNQARFELARLQETQGEPQTALKTLAPLLDNLRKRGAEPQEALLVAARSHLSLKDAPAAEAVTTAFLQRTENSGQRDAALALRAASRLMQKQPQEALQDWKTLLEDFPASDLRIPATRDLAERAYATGQWSAAEELFRRLVSLSKGGPSEVNALSGLGWTLFRKEDYPGAAEAFGTLVKNYPTADPLAPEAAYLRGKALQETGDLPQAAEAYRTAFDVYAPADPPAAGAEADGSIRNVYLAGLQLARVLRLEKKVGEADEAYAALVKVFPNVRNLDALLDEWALLHYEAENYERADAIYRQLVEQRPQSEFADNAKLTLAESALFGNDLGTARKMLTELIESKASDAGVKQRAYSLLVGIASQEQRWQEVRQLATAFLEQFPQSAERPVVLHQLGEAQLQLGQLDAAADTLQTVLTLGEQPNVRAQPWFPRNSILLAEVAFQQRRYDDATRYAESVNSMTPPPSYAFLADEVLGRVLKNQRKFDESRAAFQRVLDNENARRTETAARAQYEIAQTYFLQERWADAQTAAFKVYTLYAYPQWQAPALYMAGTCDDALGRPEQATATYRDVVKEFPGTQYAEMAQNKLQQGTSPTRR